MIAKKTKRRTDRVQPEMSEVIVNGGPLSILGRGLQEINETLAHHAAWTEERFDAVEERLGGLELGQQNIRAGIAGLSTQMMDGLSGRVGNLEIAFVGMRADMVKMETRLGGGIDEMKTQIRDDIDKLAVRVDRVLSFAAKDEPKLAAAHHDGPDRATPKG